MRKRCRIVVLAAMIAIAIVLSVPSLALSTDYTVRVTRADGRPSSKPSADVADGGTGGFKSATHTMNSTGYDGIDVGTAVPLNTTHRSSNGSEHANVATNTTHGGLINDPHSVTKAQVGLTDVADILDKLDATEAPTVNNDVDEGYSVGSQWFDVTNDKVYACTDTTDGAAVWTETTGAGVSQLSDLSDVGDTTDTDGNVLRADGDSWESAVLAHSDITAGDGSDHDFVTFSTWVETDAPDANDDSGDGFQVGSVWVDVTGNVSYICVDATPTAAVWVETTAGAAGGETNTASNVGTDGVGVWFQKAGVDLEFRHIAPASPEITVALNGQDIDLSLDFTQAYNFSGGSIWLEHNEGDAVLASAGQVAIDGVEDAIAVHFGAGGSIAGEAQITALVTIDVPMDPGAQYDIDTDVRLIELGLEVPNGFKITRWSVDFGMDPDVELDADLCYADDWAEANEEVIDVLDTTNGTSSETNPANINGGVAIPTGKRIYIRINADPEGDGDQMSFRMQGYAEED